jgi:subtilisin family serine protease
MPTQNYLFRGGEKILLEKQAEVFTTLAPDARSVQTLAQHKPVQEVKHVFSNLYKVTVEAGARDVLMDELRTSDRTPAVVHHAYHPAGDDATVYYLTDLLIVAFREGTTTTTVETILAQHGLRFVRYFAETPFSILSLQVTKSAGKNPVKVSEDLQERPEILFAEPNLVNRFQPAYTPADSLFRNQWHLKSTSGIELSPDANIDAASAWDLTRGSRSIVVAVIDDGFDLRHPDLNGASKLVFARDFVDGDLNPAASRSDYHGTPCAGLAIGEENGSGIVGVAPGCAFMPIRFGLTADDNLLYEIFNYTGKQADVISCSWGPVPVYAPLSSLLYQQLTALATTGGPRGKGCVIVFAAGNYNAPIRDMNNKDFTWRHPSQGLKQTTGPIVNGHAAHPSVVAVTASTSQNRKALYSNWGREVDVCAPSDNVHPLDYQIRVPGQAIWTAYNEALGTRYTDRFGGTSASAPMVAGAAALVLSANPSLNAQQVRDILQRTADKIVDENPDPILGLEKGTYDANGHSEWFGFGKINAFQALQLARESAGAPVTDPIDTDTGEEKPDIVYAGIRIAAILVNPEGEDRGKEQVALMNTTNEAVDLAGWQIQNKSGERERVASLIVPPGQNGIVTLKNINLSNWGGTIELLNPKNVPVDRVEYSWTEGLRVGWWKKF